MWECSADDAYKGGGGTATGPLKDMELFALVRRISRSSISYGFGYMLTIRKPSDALKKTANFENKRFSAKNGT